MKPWYENGPNSVCFVIDTAFNPSGSGNGAIVDFTSALSRLLEVSLTRTSAGRASAGSGITAPIRICCVDGEKRRYFCPPQPLSLQVCVTLKTWNLVGASGTTTS